MDRTGGQGAGISPGKKVIGVVLLAVLLVVLSFAFLHFIIPTDTDARACCGIFPDVSWNVERTAPDSVRMTLLSVDPRISTGTGNLAEVRIFANGKEVSNSSIIHASGLQDTVSPPVGLQFRDGGSVTLTGEDLRLNATKPLRLQVMIGHIVSEHFDDEALYMVYDACPDTESGGSCYSPD